MIDTPISSAAVTFAADIIHRPDEPRHFMSIRPLDRKIVIRLDNAVLVETMDVVQLLEVGHQMYRPIIYLPRDAILVPLKRTQKTTQCPLKGDCSWFSVPGLDGKDVAWSYEDTFHFADPIRGLIAFDPAFVTIEESPL